MKLNQTAIGSLFLTFLLVGCGGSSSDSPSDIVRAFNRAFISAVKQTKLGPPMVARASAIMNTCAFDAWSNFDSIALATRPESRVRQPENLRTLPNKTEAIAFASFRCASDLFPAAKSLFEEVMNDNGFDSAFTTIGVDSPRAIGNLAGQQVLDFRHSDGSNQKGDINAGAAYSDYTGYSPVNTPEVVSNPNRWQPLKVPQKDGTFKIQKFLVPQWQHVTPFGLSSGSELRQNLYQYYPSAEYSQRSDELIELSANLGDREKVIAEFWAGGPGTETPPGFWINAADFVAQRDNLTIDQNVALFFAVGNALMDASIVAWDMKRAYDTARPITTIHFLKKGQKIRAWGGPGKGTQEINGEDWQPYQESDFVTPPFPEFTSGHSTFSAAGGEILKLFTGSDVYGDSALFRKGASTIEPGVVPAENIRLNWPTFTDAINEAGISRLYGGIHFSDANEIGKTTGRVVAQKVWAKATALLAGNQ